MIPAPDANAKGHFPGWSSPLVPAGVKDCRMPARPGITSRMQGPRNTIVIKHDRIGNRSPGGSYLVTSFREDRLHVFRNGILQGQQT